MVKPNILTTLALKIVHGDMYVNSKFLQLIKSIQKQQINHEMDKKIRQIKEICPNVFFLIF